MLFLLTGMLTSSEYTSLNGVNVINASNAILINRKRISVYQTLFLRWVPGYVHLCPTSSGSQQPLCITIMLVWTPDPSDQTRKGLGNNKKTKKKQNIVQK